MANSDYKIIKVSVKLKSGKILKYKVTAKNVFKAKAEISAYLMKKGLYDYSSIQCEVEDDKINVPQVMRMKKLSD